MTETSEIMFAASAASAASAAGLERAAAYAAETDALVAEGMHLCAMAAEIKFDRARRPRRRGNGGRGGPLGGMRARMEDVARRLDERGLCEGATQLRRWAE